MWRVGRQRHIGRGVEQEAERAELAALLGECHRLAEVLRDHLEDKPFGAIGGRIIGARLRVDQAEALGREPDLLREHWRALFLEKFDLDGRLELLVLGRVAHVRDHARGDGERSQQQGKETREASGVCLIHHDDSSIS